MFGGIYCLLVVVCGGMSLLVLVSFYDVLRLVLSVSWWGCCWCWVLWEVSVFDVYWLVLDVWLCYVLVERILP